MSLKGDLFLKLQSEKSGATFKPEKTRVTTLMDSQHIKGSETVLKAARQYFCHIF